MDSGAALPYMGLRFCLQCCLKGLFPRGGCSGFNEGASKYTSTRTCRSDLTCKKEGFTDVTRLSISRYHDPGLRWALNPMGRVPRREEGTRGEDHVEVEVPECCPHKPGDAWDRLTVGEGSEDSPDRFRRGHDPVTP